MKLHIQDLLYTRHIAGDTPNQMAMLGNKTNLVTTNSSKAPEFEKNSAFSKLRSKSMDDVRAADLSLRFQASLSSPTVSHGRVL